MEPDPDQKMNLLYFNEGAPASNLSGISLTTGFFPRGETSGLGMTSTLEESLAASLLRDLIQIGKRLKYVIIPVCQDIQDPHMKSWDLWGPLLFCIILAWTLSASADPSQGSEIFATVFTLVWVGSVVITVNAKLLGSNIWFFHSVCTLGYSIFPLIVVALISIIFKNQFTNLASIGIIAVGFVWSFKAAHLYMSHLMYKETRGLSLYPILLFYIYLSFFIFEMTVV